MGHFCEEHQLDWSLGSCPLRHFWKDEVMAKKINVIEKLTSATKPQDWIAIAMDASGSMAPFEQKAFDVLVEQDANIKKLEENSSRVTNKRYYAFSHSAREISTRLVRSEYRASGGTALYDALDKIITDLEPNDVLGEDRSFLVVFVTDGQESGASWLATSTSIRNRIEAKQARGNWTFVVLGPFGSKSIFKSLGVPEGNIEEWDSTQPQEYQRMSADTVASTQSYSTLRASGVGQTRSFFTPNLSKVDLSDARRVLSDVTAQYKRVAVSREGRIDVFAAYHTGKDYVPGTVFYPLTKTEKVRPGIELLLRDKTSREVFGGDVRKVLGLSASGEVRVEPGNHANWDIFIQSQSDNRLLVRGSHVLIKQ